MKTEQLGRNDLSPAGFIWYGNVLEAIDQRDVEAFSGYLAEDCVLQLNNSPPVRGKSAIVLMLQPLWERIDGLEHDLINIIGSDHHFALEAEHHYRIEGRDVVVRAAAFTDRDDNGKVRSMSLYYDTEQLRGTGADQ